MPAKDKNKRYKLNGNNICPYHVCATSQVLRCEGFENLSTAGFSWANIKDKKFWQKKYCEKGGKGCPHAKSLVLEKYSPIENAERAVAILKAFKIQFPDDEIEVLCDFCIDLIQ